MKEEEINLQRFYACNEIKPINVVSDHDKLLGIESLAKGLQDFDNKYPGFDAALGKIKTQALIEKFKKDIFFALSCERSGMGRLMAKKRVFARRLSVHCKPTYFFEFFLVRYL